MPARLRSIIKIAERYGVTFTTPTSGSHWKACKDGFRAYPIPAHNGRNTEISDEYIRGFCRAFAIDFNEFKKQL